MPTVRRVLETALYFDDLPRAAAFYRDVLGLTPLTEQERLVAMDAGEGTVLLLFQRGSTEQGADTDGGWIPPHDGHGPAHVALAVDAADLEAWRERLVRHGVEVESEVIWPRGGMSLYLRDPERHSVELACPGVWSVY